MKEDEREKLEKALSYRVSKSNEMVQRARYSLSLREGRALEYAISKIQKTDKPGKVYRVDPKEAYRIVTASEGRMGGRELRAAYEVFQSLQYRPVEISPKAGVRVSCNFLHHVTIDENSNTLSFEMDSKLAPYLLDQYKNFTAYELRNTAKMRSVYGPRLYQVLKSYAKGRKIEKAFTLDELREAIGASFEAFKNKRGVYEVKATKSYEMYGKLKQAVIDPAVEDINTYSDMRVEYEAIKTGRKVTAVQFKVNDDHAEAGARFMDQLDRKHHPGRYAE